MDFVSTSSLESLKNERVEVLAYLTKLDQAIAAYNGTSGEIPWTVKALSCIKQFNSFVQTNDILECVLFESPILQNEKMKRGAMTSLSVTLNKLCKHGKLVKFTESGIQGNFYGFPEWTDKTGQPKQKYLNIYHEKIEERITA